MSRTKVTEDCWPDETPEQVIARIRAEHGDAVADVVAKALVTETKRKKQVPQVVGKRPVRRMALGQGLVPKQGVAWDEGGAPFSKPGERLPRSGAGPVVRVVPRAHARRRGLNDS